MDLFGNEESSALMDNLLNSDVLDQLIHDLDIPIEQEQQDYQSHTNHSHFNNTHTFQQPTIKYEVQEQEQCVSTTQELEEFVSTSSLNVNTTNMNSECPVCLDGEAGRHTYYGGRACHSCRGFFRRSVQSGHHQLFRCKSTVPGVVPCEVRSKSRRSCQKCRFDRCLTQAGLRPDLVMSLEQRRARVIKRSSAKKGIVATTNNVQSSALMAGLTQSKLLNLGFTEDEGLRLRTDFDSLMSHNHRRYTDFLEGAGKKHLDSFVDTIATGTPYDKELLKVTFALDAQSTKNFAFDVPKMSLLPASDRVTLISTNFRAVAGLMWVWFVSNRRAYLEHFVGHAKDSKISPMLASKAAYYPRVNFGGSGSNLKEAYQPEIAQSMDPSSDLEGMRSEVMECLMSADNKEVDPALVVLISMAMLFDSDGLMLESPEKAGEAYRGYLGDLHKYFKSTRLGDNDMAKLEKCVKMIKVAKKFYDVHVNSIDAKL